MQTKTIAILIPLFLLGACGAPSRSSSNQNPSFVLTKAEARSALREMESDKKLFARPVVVAAGYLDPAIGVAHVAGALRAMTPDPSQVIVVPFFSLSRFESCRARLIEFVESGFPSEDPTRTVAVDVIGVSMGGLVARDAAIPGDDGGGTLNIVRLFTVSTPHRGADAAELPTLDSRVRDMRAGSAFLGRLDAAAMEEGASGNAYRIIAYTRLDDGMVGTQNTIPPRGDLYWLPNEPLELAHLHAHHDERIFADIARRLRGEAPFATDPPSPLPDTE